MIDISALQEIVSEGRDWTMIAPDGAPCEEPVVPQTAGPASLLVSKVTDAVKRVGDDGLVEGSVDRDQLWALQGFLLNRVVLAKLEGKPMDAVTLLETIPRIGIGWQFVIRDS